MKIYSEDDLEKLKSTALENQSKYDCIKNRKDTAVLIHPILDEGFANFTDLNECACRQYGYTREELLTLSAYHITDSTESKKHATPDFRRRLLEDGHMVFESKHIKKNGDVFPVEIDAMVFEHDGKSLIASVVRDITKRKVAEQQLRESELRFRALVEQATDAIYLSDLKGNILEINESACRDTGYIREELLSLNIKDVDAESRDFDFETFWKNMNPSEPATIESFYIRKNGTTFPVEVRIGSILVDGERGVMGLARDISLRREQDQKIREGEMRFRNLLENVSSLAVQGYYGDGTIFFWNEANTAIYGYTPEEAIGQNLVDLIIPDSMKADVRALIKEAGWTGELNPPSELQLQGKDGKGIWVYSSHASVKVGDKYELYCLDIDLSAIKQLQLEKEIALEALTIAKEQAESASKAKDEFLAVMSHEMRTPLNPIVGFASLMLQDCRSEQTTLLESIMNSSSRLLALIEDVLDFARLERGELKTRVSRVDVIDVCKTAIHDVEGLSDHLELSFTNGFDDFVAITGSLEVSCDKNVLLRIIDNLLTNACKYTHEGYVRLKVGMKKQGRGLPLFVFVVEDSGIGIPNKHLRTLFSPFNQVDTSYTRSYEGVGLGLAVCSKLVDLMGGQIYVKSVLGEGSRFWFEIPLKVLNSINSNDEYEGSMKPLKFDRKLNVLVVEDNPDNFLLACSIIEMAGGRCSVAENGMSALQVCSKEKFDLILMDLSMPVMDGFEATNKIINEGGLNSDTPILALTAHISNEVRVKCLDAQMVGHVTKPVQFEDLIEAIQQLNL